jgi:negative regulator of sigma E activity
MTTGAKKTAAGFAVAASIAAAVVFTVLRPPMPADSVIAESPAQLEGQPLSSGATLVSSRAATMEVPRQQEIPQVDINTGNPDLDRYLRQHQDYIGSGTFGPGFATATMVSYDGR